LTNKNATEGILKLVEIMATLRSPGGCPWDKEQTPETLKPYVLEEVYELLEAIDDGDTTDICDELGDLLLQSGLHSANFQRKKQVWVGRSCTVNLQ